MVSLDFDKEYNRFKGTFKFNKEVVVRKIVMLLAGLFLVLNGYYVLAASCLLFWV